MKTLYFFFAAAIAAFCLSSCDPDKYQIKDLNQGSGIWDMESLRIEYYDTDETTITKDTTAQNPGELVFFESETIGAFNNYFLVVALTKGVGDTITGHPGQIFYDGVRVHIKEDASIHHSFPDNLEGLWTVQENEKESQTWVMIYFDENGTNKQRRTLVLKKQK